MLLFPLVTDLDWFILKLLRGPILQLWISVFSLLMDCRMQAAPSPPPKVSEIEMPPVPLLLNPSKNHFVSENNASLSLCNPSHSSYTTVKVTVRLQFPAPPGSSHLGAFSVSLNSGATSCGLSFASSAPVLWFCHSRFIRLIAIFPYQYCTIFNVSMVIMGLSCTYLELCYPVCWSFRHKLMVALLSNFS